VDVQLGFNNENKRMGMATMIEERVPYNNPTLRRLPSKDLPSNFYSSFGRNKRCFPIPLSNQLALYSVDDLHRIEVILQMQSPDMRDYTSAKEMTRKIIVSLESPSESVVKWVGRERQFFGRKYGSKKQEKAVQIARAVRHAELVFGASLSSQDKRDLDKAKKLVTIALDESGVDIPSDLSFHGCGGSSDLSFRRGYPKHRRGYQVPMRCAIPNPPSVCLFRDVWIMVIRNLYEK
jgi:hypothetical protein